MNPKASVVMVTRNRRIFARRALHYIRRQTYRPIEHIVIDNSDVRDQFLYSTGAKVEYYKGRLRIGALRNIGVRAATGDYIVFLDDDDWYSSGYVARNVALLESGAQVSGFVNSYWYDIRDRFGYQQNNWGRLPGCLSMAAHRDYLLRFPFDESLVVGEDTAVGLAAEKRKDRVVVSDDPNWLVYMRHSNNTTGNIRPGSCVDRTSAVRALMDETDLDFYDGLSELMHRNVATPSSHLPPTFQLGGLVA
jgi:glycosyltransferase involved in cell wall biosynthesis